MRRSLFPVGESVARLRDVALGVDLRAMDIPVFGDLPAKPQASDASIPGGARKGTKEPTERQLMAYNLRKAGVPYAEAARAMGCAVPTVQSLARAAEAKGMPVLPKVKLRDRPGSIDPDAARRFAEKMQVAQASAGAPEPAETAAAGFPVTWVDAADPQASTMAPTKPAAPTAPGEFDVERFMEMAAAASVPPRLAADLARRVQANLSPLREPMPAMGAKEFAEAVRLKAQMMLRYIDETSVPTASLKDLVIAFGVMVDKAQLLGGKPTQIYDVNLRAKLAVMMPAFVAEARRRGITVEGDFAQIAEKQ